MHNFPSLTRDVNIEDLNLCVGDPMEEATQPLDDDDEDEDDDDEEAASKPSSSKKTRGR